MTDEKSELRIWEAAYAQAFVADFQRTCDVATRLPPGDMVEMPFDTAMRVTGAERAMDIADAAVREYRQWRDEEMEGQVLEDRVRKLESNETDE